MRVPVVAGTATALPFADDAFDVVFSAFGALQFVADAGRAVDEAARVLRPGGTVRVLGHASGALDDAGRPDQRGPAWSPAPTGTARRTSRRTTRDG